MIRPYVHPAFIAAVALGKDPDKKSGLILLDDGLHLDRYGNRYPGDGTILPPDGGVLRKYPEAPDNPGRVSEGTARHLENMAEAYQAGGQAIAIAVMRNMGSREERRKKRNERKRARR